MFEYERDQAESGGPEGYKQGVGETPLLRRVGLMGSGSESIKFALAVDSSFVTEGRSCRSSW